MKLKGLFIALLLGMTAPLISCGPDKSLNDSKDEQNREEYEKQVANFSPAVGSYDGFIETYEKNKRAARLVVIIKTETEKLPGRTVRTATLHGTLVADPDSDNPTLLATYKVGHYDPLRKSIDLTSADGEKSFSGHIDGHNIRGTVVSPHRILIFEGTRQID